MKETLSIIIPVWGEKELVRVLYNRLIAVLKEMPVNYKIIYVNDACPFGSGEELKKLANMDKNITLINLSRNFGEAVAVKAGIDNCDTDYAVVMDCDLQDRPEDIPILFNKLKEGYDVVWGERVSREDNRLKQLYSKAFYIINNCISEIKTDKKIGSFSIITKKVINELKKINDYTFNYIQMVEYLGFKKTYVPITKSKRALGKSGYNFVKGASLALKIMISSSGKPLLIPIFSSLFMFCLSFICIFLILINKILFSPQYLYMLIILFLMFGILFLNIGIVALYIGIIIKEILTKPRYVIDNKIEERHLWQK